MRGVAVLAAVLAQAGRVALDVARIERGLFEGRREQQSQAVVAADQALVQRRHRHGGARGIGGAGEHRPGLRDRIDPAFVARLRSRARFRRRSRAAIPFAVPGLALERLAQRGRMCAPAARAVRVALVGQRREQRDGARAEPAEPDAFALAAFADPVHAVVPVAAADQRQAVPAGQLQALVEAAGAMLEQ